MITSQLYAIGIKKTFLLISLFVFSTLSIMVFETCHFSEEKISSKSGERSQKIHTFFDIDEYAIYPQNGSIQYIYPFDFAEIPSSKKVNLRASVNLNQSSSKISFFCEYRVLEKTGNTIIDWTNIPFDKSEKTASYNIENQEIKALSKEEDASFLVEVRIAVPSMQNMTVDEVHYYLGFETLSSINITISHHNADLS